MTTPSTPSHAGPDPGWKQALDQVLAKVLMLLATAALAFVATLLHDLTAKTSRLQDQVTQLPPDLGTAVNQLGTALGNQVDTLAQRPAAAPAQVTVTAPRAPASAPTQVTVTTPAAAPAATPTRQSQPAAGITRPTPAPSPAKPSSPCAPGLLAVLCPKP
jgi:hypothetical protein